MSDSAAVDSAKYQVGRVKTLVPRTKDGDGLIVCCVCSKVRNEKKFPTNSRAGLPNMRWTECKDCDKARRKANGGKGT